MQLYILNKEYDIIGTIDEAESVLWHKKYNDIGESEIYIPCEAAYLELLQNGYKLFRYDDDMCCQIQRREITTDAEEGDYIIATATDICSILAGRIVRWQIVYSGTVAGFIEKVLTDNVISPAQPQRAIPNFVIDKSNFAELTEQIEITAVTDDLLQLIITTCKSYNYGFRLSWDINTRKLVFRLYKGVKKSSVTDAEYVEFSPQFANILSSAYAEDESNYKNLVYVGYKGTDEQTHLLSLFDVATEPTGEARKEIYIDGTGTSRDITYEELKQMFPNVTKTAVTGEKTITATYYATVNGESVAVATSEQNIPEEGAEEAEKITVTDYTYLLLIRFLGLNAFSSYRKTQEFSGEVDTLDSYAYKTDYNLGDIVKVINDYGIEAEAQITEIMESDEADGGYNVEPTFEYIS